MDWVSAGKGSAYVVRSVDGYYAIEKHPGFFDCNYIEALWAKPVLFATSPTLKAAKAACEQRASKR